VIDHRAAVQAALAQLRQRLEDHLARVPAVLRADARRILEEEGRLLSPASEDGAGPSFLAGVWPLLTLFVAQYVQADIDPAYATTVAISLELFVCATDVLDDLMDDDMSPRLLSDLGKQRVLNLSAALLVSGHQALLSLEQLGIPPARILALVQALTDAAGTAFAGQHQDLLDEGKPAHRVSRAACLNVARAKAGSIMGLAFHLGALCAGAPQTLCRQLARVGELLGIAHQLDNDSHDLYSVLQDSVSVNMPFDAKPAARSRKSDLERGKKTLPIVLAAHQVGIPLGQWRLAAAAQTEEFYRLQEGIVTTWGVCILYREQAYDRLRKLARRKPLTPTLSYLIGLESGTPLTNAAAL